jgi:hypothetical protein
MEIEIRVALLRVPRYPTDYVIAIRVYSGTSSQRCAAHTHKSVLFGWHAKTFEAVNSNFDQRLM